MHRVEESSINYDLIEDVLQAVLVDRGVFVPTGGEELESGAVLVFLPGLGEIRTLNDRLLGSRVFGNRTNFEVVPLHSTLSAAEQRRAFRIPQNGCRKIILSTNIAETSVTIPDVVCGKSLVHEITDKLRFSLLPCELFQLSIADVYARSSATNEPPLSV